MHGHCAEFAATVCPFVSGKKLEYSNKPADTLGHIEEMASDQRPEKMYILTTWSRKTTFVQAASGNLLISAGARLKVRELRSQ
jgi:hypothetical protein